MRRRSPGYAHGLAPLLVALALLMKLAIPAGYMPVRNGAATVLMPCSGFGPEAMRGPSMAGMIALPDGAHRSGRPEHPGAADMPCGFAGHAPAAMAGADPVLLAVAIALIVATVFRMPLAWRVRRVVRLRPPSQGPPARA